MGSKGREEQDAVMTCSPGPLALPQINIPRFPGLSYLSVRDPFRVSNKAIIEGKRAGNTLNKLFSVHETLKYTLRGHGK